MRCITVNIVALAFLGALCGSAWGQYFNNRPYPTYSLEHMPDTRFSCRDKVLGGYYADSETQCQMFHICVKVAGLGVQDFRFLCPNGTAFDQDSQICADWDDVDCEAATLYYSSDNFDLYRVGSGFETAPFPGEDEATFHLQRSETGDARLSHEHQSARVNQQTNYNTAFPPKKPIPHGRNQERDLLRGSSSSNFFNNRNGGKDLDDDDYTDTGAPNQNTEVNRKKIVRKYSTRKPAEENYETQTQKVTKFTGFSNNFAGSIPTSTARPLQKQEQVSNERSGSYRGRQGSRRGGERQYNNAENFRNNNNEQYTGRNNEQYNGRNNEQYSTRNTQNTDLYSTRNTEQYNTRNTDQYNNRNTQQAISTTTTPYRQTAELKYKTVNRQPTVNDNTPTTAAPKTTYDNQRTRAQQTDTTITKQTENYPSTASPFKTVNTYKKETENYPTTLEYTNKQNYDVQKKPTTQYKQTENYPTTFAPNKQTYQKQTTQYYQTNKETEAFSKVTSAQTNTQAQYTQTDYKQYETTRNTAAKTTGTTQQGSTGTDYNVKQTNQNSQSSDYNTKQYTQSTDYNTKYDNTRFQTTQYNTQQYSTTIKPSTQHTPYSPTVPKQTTQYPYTSTTPSTRFSKQFDETSYDDGSYNPKYDDEKYKSEDEFLKTAHSTNFASARNEFLNNNAKSTNPSTQSPRPFSATTQVAKTTNQSRGPSTVAKSSQTSAKSSQTAAKSTTSVAKPSETTIKAKSTSKKPEKDVSYDYAYYDSNVGSEPDYDVGTEFSKSTKKTN